MTAPRNVLLLPCKHLVLCGSCFGRMSADARRQHTVNAADLPQRFVADWDDDGLLQRLLHPEDQRSAPATFGGNGNGSSSSATQRSNEPAEGTVPRRRSSHREWLGPLPPGVLLPGQVDYHWWAHPVSSTAGQGSAAGLEVRGIGIGRGAASEAARMARHDGLRYGALVRCPMCRRAVEQSVSGVLIV
jgi:hypothetical protein